MSYIKGQMKNVIKDIKTETDVSDSADNSFLIVISRCQRIASAVYLVASFFDDRDDIVKMSLMKSSIGLIDSVFDVSKIGSVVWKESILFSVGKVESYTYLALSVGIISEASFILLKRQLESFSRNVNSLENVSMIHSFISHRQRDVPKALLEKTLKDISVLNEEKMLQGVRSKGFVRQGGDVFSAEGVKDIGRNISFGVTDQDPKSELSSRSRMEIILDVLKKNSRLSIKDFVSFVSRVSEKTLQRDLLALVASGRVVKEGERRWSRYSLKI